AKRNVTQRERQRQRIECTRSQSCDREQSNQQTVTVDQRKIGRNQRKYGRREQQNPSWPEQASQINREWTDEHQAYVIDAGNPGSIIKTNSDIPLEIGQTKRKQPPRKRYNSRAQYHSQDSKQGTMREVNRERRYPRGRAGGRPICGKRNGRCAHCLLLFRSSP